MAKRWLVDVVNADGVVCDGGSYKSFMEAIRAASLYIGRLRYREVQVRERVGGEVIARFQLGGEVSE
jgi:hypothetical protein